MVKKDHRLLIKLATEITLKQPSLLHAKVGQFNFEFSVGSKLLLLIGSPTAVGSINPIAYGTLNFCQRRRGWGGRTFWPTPQKTQ